MNPHRPAIEALSIRGPVFRVCGDDVTVLTQPAEFIAALRGLLARATRRIVVAALYVDLGEEERALVALLDRSLEANTGLTATLLFDRARSMRPAAEPPHATSVDLLAPLTRHGPRVELRFYQTALLTPLLRRLLPSPALHEVVGVQHLKVFIGDDDLLLSGANLSVQYFTTRQDRYWLFHNAGLLASWYARLIRTVGDFAFAVDSPSTRIVRPRDQDSETQPERFNESLRAALKGLLGPTSPPTDGTDRPDTWVFPTIQLGSAGVTHDAEVTCELLRHCSSLPGGRLSLASPYFNIAPAYRDLLTRDGQSCHLQVLTAHPTANGFHGAKGLRGHIPSLYLLALESFWRHVQHTDRGSTVSLWEWLRPGWTFHAKGLWFAPDGGPVTISAVGSPNWGERSAYRDLESQVFVFTANFGLQARLTRERDALFAAAAPVTPDRLRRPDRTRIPLWLRLAARHARPFL